MYMPLSDTPKWPATTFAYAGGEALGLGTYSGDRQADVIVIGGGFVGCSAALHLAEAGKSVILLEKNEIGWGSAGRNAGHVAPHSTKLEPDAVLRTYGPVHGQRMLDFGRSTASFVLGLAKKHDIDVSPVPGGIVTAAHVPAAMPRLERRRDYWDRLQEPAEILDRKQTAEVLGSNLYAGSLIERRGIAINPLAFVRGLARAAIKHGAELYEHSGVTSLDQTNDGWLVKTGKGTVRGGHVLLCTNAYTGTIWPGLNKSFIAVRGRQVWTKPLDQEDRAKIMRGVSAFLETRRLPTGARLNNDGRLMFGGGDPTVGSERMPDMQERVRFVANMFPDIKPVEIEGWWSGWVTRGIRDGWRIHRLAPNLFTAVACNGRGVAMGPAMGRELASLVNGASDNDLLIPVSDPVKLQGYAFHQIVFPFLLQAMKWKDRREIKAYDRQLVQSGQTPRIPAHA